jgi:hypothetical protein
MKQPTKPFALCVDNTDYKASLIPGKVYRIIPDPRAARDDFVRIVDESGEDYALTPRRFRLPTSNALNWIAASPMTIPFRRTWCPGMRSRQRPGRAWGDDPPRRFPARCENRV